MKVMTTTSIITIKRRVSAVDHVSTTEIENIEATYGIEIETPIIKVGPALV